MSEQADKRIEIRICVAYSDETGLWAAFGECGATDAENAEWAKQVVGIDDLPRVVGWVNATIDVPEAVEVAGVVQQELFAE